MGDEEKNEAFNHLVKPGERMFSHIELDFKITGKTVFVRNVSGEEVFEEEPAYKGLDLNIKMSIVREFPPQKEFGEFIEDQICKMQLEFVDKFGVSDPAGGV